MGLAAAASVYQSIVFRSDYPIALRLIPILVYFGIPIWLSLLARRGVNWARALILIGGSITLVGSVISVVVNPVSGVGLDGIVIVALIVILVALPPVFMWLPATNAYFRAVAEEKRIFRERQLR